MQMSNVHIQNTNNQSARRDAFDIITTSKELEELERTLNVHSTCAQCNNLNKYPLPATPETIKRFGGQTYEIVGRYCEQCGYNLWLITIPPTRTTIDDMIGDENENDN